MAAQNQYSLLFLKGKIIDMFFFVLLTSFLYQPWVDLHTKINESQQILNKQNTLFTNKQA